MTPCTLPEFRPIHFLLFMQLFWHFEYESYKICMWWWVKMGHSHRTTCMCFKRSAFSFGRVSKRFGVRILVKKFFLLNTISPREISLFLYSVRLELNRLALHRLFCSWKKNHIQITICFIKNCTDVLDPCPF